MGTYAFDKANTKMVHVKLNLRTDADIISHLEEQSNKQSYLKSLIRADIAAHAAQPFENPQSKKEESP